MSTIKSSDEHLTINADGSGKDIKLQNNGSESVAITSTGVGIGTSSPSVKTEIQHSGTGGFPATSGTAQTYGILRLNSGGGWTSALDIGNNGGDGAWIQSTDTSNLATNYALYINKNGGQVRVGSGGITFNGDTSSSNALDDYETGTIDISTMNFTGSGSLTTQTAGNVLEYIKIGDLVTITGNIYVGVVTSQSGDLKIPLPFAAKNTVGTRAPGVIASYSQNIVAVAKVEQNKTYARLVKPYLWGVVNISNNDTYVVGISYIAA